MQSLLFCVGAIGGVEWCSWHTSSSGHTSVAVGPVEWPSTIEVDGLVLVMLICEWWHLWRHLDDICGLYVILVDNLWWYLSWLWIICDGYVIYVIVVRYVIYMWWLCDICMCGCNKQKNGKKANFPAMPSAITKTLGKARKFAKCPALPSAMAIALGKGREALPSATSKALDKASLPLPSAAH